MRAIVNTGPGRVELKEWPLPEPAPGQVRIRTGACGLCATDLKMIDGWDRTGFPSIPGHEWAGTVEKLGSGVARELLGVRCVAENVLADGGEVGFEHPGGYGEFLVTEAAKIHVLPAGFPMAEAALIEPLAVCLRAVRRLRLEDRRSALIFGDGPIGLLMLLLLRRAGVEEVCLIGGRDGRLRLAQELGASLTLNYHALGTRLIAEVKQNVSCGFPNVVEASGSGAALQACLELALPCGKVLMIGDYGSARADFPWLHILLREIELIGSNASAGAWPEAVHLAVERSLPLGQLISHRVAPADFARGLELIRSHRDDVVKVVLQWQ